VRTITIGLLATLLVTVPCLAEQWVGWVTDEKCASAGKYSGTEHDKCVQAGQAIVFVTETDKKVFKLRSDDKAKGHLGQKVRLTGTATGDTIEVTEVAAAMP
jgi:hypothetical protein